MCRKSVPIKFKSAMLWLVGLFKTDDLKQSKSFDIDHFPGCLSVSHRAVGSVNTVGLWLDV